MTPRLSQPSMALLILCLILIVVLPRFVWLSFSLIAVPVLAFSVAVYKPALFWDFESEQPRWQYIGQAIVVACGALVVLQAVTVIFGDGIFATRSLIVFGINLLVFGGVPTLTAIGFALWLDPLWHTVRRGLIGIIIGGIILMMNVLIPLNLLWVLLAVPLIFTSGAIWREDHETPIRSAILTGSLTALIPSIALSVTVRVILCMGATTCTEHYDIGRAILLYGTTALYSCLALPFLMITAWVTLRLKRLYIRE